MSFLDEDLFEKPQSQSSVEHGSVRQCEFDSLQSNAQSFRLKKQDNEQKALQRLRDLASDEKIMSLVSDSQLSSTSPKLNSLVDAPYSMDS